MFSRVFCRTRPTFAGRLFPPLSQNGIFNIVPFNRTIYSYEIHTPKFMSLVHRDVSQLFLIDVI